MIRAYKYDNNSEFKDFENFLFSNPDNLHEIIFDFPNDKVTIDTVDYKISTLINNDGSFVFPEQIDNTVGYRIANTDKATAIKYYGRINSEGKWYIMRETTSNTYTYTRGGSDFETNWTDRVDLIYIGFNNLIWS